MIGSAVAGKGTPYKIHFYGTKQLTTLNQTPQKNNIVRK